MTAPSYYVERYPRTRPNAGPAIPLFTGIAIGLLLPAIIFFAAGGGRPCRHDLACTLVAGTPAIQQAPGPWRYLSASVAPAPVEPRMVCYSGRAPE